MGSSARLTLVLLLIFVLGTALLLDGKEPTEGDKKKADQEKLLAKNGTAGGGSGWVSDTTDTQTPDVSGRVEIEQRPVVPRPTGRQTPPNVEHDPGSGSTRVAQGRRPTVDTGPRAARGGTRLATVRPGDSWWRIAKREVGSGVYHKQLSAANPGVTLHPGIKVRIPAISRSGRRTAPSTTRTVSAERQARPRVNRNRARSRRLPAVHVVQPGESLWKIARRYYGKGHMHWVIADHNGLSDEDSVRAGMRLNIPSR